MPKYIKKSLIINAELYKEGMEDGYACYAINGEFTGYFKKNGPLPKNQRIPAIKTLEGFHEITEGDYVITGIKGERYPCKPDIFKKTYEMIEEE